MTRTTLLHRTGEHRAKMDGLLRSPLVMRAAAPQRALSRLEVGRLRAGPFAPPSASVRGLARVVAIAMMLCGCDRGPPCASDRDCASGVCGLEGGGGDLEDLAPLVTSCRGLGADSASCAGPAECARGVCAAAGQCLVPCADDSDCAGGERCLGVWARGAGDHLHLTRACVREISVAPGVEVTELPIDEGLGSLAEIELPPATSGAVSYAVVPHERRYADESILGRLTGLDALDDPPRSLIEPVEGEIPGIYPLASVPAFIVPFDLSAMHSASGYRAVLADYHSLVDGRAEATPATAVRLARATAGTRLDLDVFVVGPADDGFGRSRAGRIERVLPEIDAILEQVGLTLGDVRFHVIRGQLGARFYGVNIGGPADASSELGEMLRLTAGLERPSVSIFAVRQANAGFGCLLGGISAGIPGPQGIHGSESSGVVIALEALYDDDLALVITHEIGHFLGLRHTTEAYGLDFDGFRDTPRCGTDRDTDFDGIVLPSECAASGADNLMFWAAIGTTLSAEQGGVLRSSPLLQ